MNKFLGIFLLLSTFVPVMSLERQQRDIETGIVSEDKKKSLFHFIKTTLFGSREKMQRKKLMAPVKARVNALDPAEPNDNQVIEAIKNITSSTGEGLSATNVQRLKDFVINVTAEESERLRDEAEKSWSRKKAITAITCVGTAASIASTLIVKFYDTGNC